MNNKRHWGDYMQEGGIPQPQMGMPLEEMAPMPDPQQLAEEFLQAFQQLPPEAQQIVIQTLTAPLTQ